MLLLAPINTQPFSSSSFCRSDPQTSSLSSFENLIVLRRDEPPGSPAA